MKILVLGNGFDLDHNLPTGYKHFLNFCGHLLYGKSLAIDFFGKLTDTQIKYIKKLEKKKELKNKFASLLQGNYLLRYFLFQMEYLGENWIDLEREIASIIYEFKEIEEEFRLSKQYRYTAASEHKIHELIEQLGMKDIDCRNISEKSLNGIHEALYRSLDNFSKALEIYIVEFINTTRVSGVSPDIIDFGATKILTFNYSQTYERVYSGVQIGEVINHIHGTAQSMLGEQANVILGVTSNDSQLNNRYVDFEKYFQRITKQTGSKYKEWLSANMGTEKAIEVAFFGHSLDSSDSDVIKDLVCNEDTVVTVFYYDEKAHQNIVANLIDIIGKQKLIEYSSGTIPKICFKKQKKHQHNNTAGVEIERDIRKLYKLYTLKQNEINRLLEKIDKKIRNNIISYFHAQRKTIDLFEALKYAGINQYKKETFFEFCQLLDYETTKNGNLKYYEYDEWCGETAWGQTIDCDKDTKQLVDSVNNANKIRFQEKQVNIPYSNLLTLDTVRDMKSALLDIFKEEPSETYWKDLSQIMLRMLTSEILLKAVREIIKENVKIEICSKAKYFEMTFMEQIYNYQIWQQWEEEKKNNG